MNFKVNLFFHLYETHITPLGIPIPASLMENSIFFFKLSLKQSKYTKQNLHNQTYQTYETYKTKIFKGKKSKSKN